MIKYKTEREFLQSTLLKDGDYKSTKEIFERLAKTIPNQNILAELNQNKEIIYHNAGEILRTIELFGSGMLSLGYENKHIAIIAENSYRYIISDMAIIGGIGVVTPIDKDANDETLTTLINRCDASIILCSSYLANHIKELSINCKKVKEIITIDKKVENFICYDEIIALGSNEKYLEKYKNKKLDLNATVEILFTSGTTGLNKGVEFSQNNISANIINCLDVIKAEKKNNTSMSILPMHHATEINTHILPRIAAGRLTYINGNMKDMMRNIKIFKPYVITVVPMIANAFYKTIWQQAKKQGKDKKLVKGIKLCKLLNKFNINITHKLFKNIYSEFGGNLKQIVCGGAPLNPEVVAGLRDLGIFISNGFGITECGPLVSINTDTIKDVQSIGKACPKLQIKVIDKNENGIGELCVKGKSVAKRYYNDSNATSQVFDKDGYFHTGDLVRLDNENKIFLAGRKKNLIVLDNGKNVYPEEIEEFFCNKLDYIKDIVVYEAKCLVNQEEKKMICAGLYIDKEKSKSIDEILLDFRNINKLLPTYKHISYLDISENEYEKSASKKIIRVKALEKHSIDKGIII